jgi:hypothetical protein
MAFIIDFHVRAPPPMSWMGGRHGIRWAHGHFQTPPSEAALSKRAWALQPRPCSRHYSEPVIDHPAFDCGLKILVFTLF